MVGANAGSVKVRLVVTTQHDPFPPFPRQFLTAPTVFTENGIQFHPHCLPTTIKGNVSQTRPVIHPPALFHHEQQQVDPELQFIPSTSSAELESGTIATRPARVLRRSVELRVRHFVYLVFYCSCRKKSLLSPILF